MKPQWAHQDKYKYNYTEEFWAMPDTIKAKDSTEIAETIENYFLSGEVDKIEIAYSRLGLESGQRSVSNQEGSSAIGLTYHEFVIFMKVQ